MTAFRGAAALAMLAVVARPDRGVAHQLSLTLIDTAVLAAPQLDESSGIVASRRRPGVFWSHNDSGNRSLLFATDSSGADLGYVTVRGAAAVDWEDLSAGLCTRSAGTCLYLADTGDNDGVRGNVMVYLIPEPDPPAGPGDTQRVVAPEDTLVLRYPDHPHDTEAIAVIDRQLYLVTKDRFGPALLFSAAIDGAKPQTLRAHGALAMRISTLRGRLATGATASADGRLLVVRTYASIHVFSVQRGVVAPLTTPDGLPIPVVETQGEAVCFDRAGRLVLTSERGRRGHAILTRLRLNGSPRP